MWSHFQSLLYWFQIQNWNTNLKDNFLSFVKDSNYIVEIQNTTPFERKVGVKLSDWKLSKLNTGTWWGSEEQCNLMEHTELAAS